MSRYMSLILMAAACGDPRPEPAMTPVERQAVTFVERSQGYYAYIQASCGPARDGWSVCLVGVARHRQSHSILVRCNATECEPVSVGGVGVR